MHPPLHSRQPAMVKGSHTQDLYKIPLSCSSRSKLYIYLHISFNVWSTGIRISENRWRKKSASWIEWRNFRIYPIFSLEVTACISFEMHNAQSLKGKRGITEPRLPISLLPSTKHCPPSSQSALTRLCAHTGEKCSCTTPWPSLEHTLMRYNMVLTVWKSDKEK